MTTQTGTNNCWRKTEFFGFRIHFDFKIETINGYKHKFDSKVTKSGAQSQLQSCYARILHIGAYLMVIVFILVYNNKLYVIFCKVSV